MESDRRGFFCLLAAGVGFRAAVIPIYRSLIGVDPMDACGLEARVAGHAEVLKAVPISQETAARIKAHWEASYSGANIGNIWGSDGVNYRAAILKQFHVPNL